MKRGDLDAADSSTKAARAIKVVDELRAAGVALASRLATAKGQLEEAIALATEACRIDALSQDLELTHGFARLALAEAHAARGEKDAARTALAPVVASIDRLVSTIRIEARRPRFRERPFANDRVAKLARELGLPT